MQNTRKAPTHSHTTVMSTISESVRRTCVQEFISSNSLIITLPARPELIKRYIKKKVIVMRPRPPICMSARITACPNRVNASREIVVKPVTQVADVAVKIRSMSEIGIVRAIGSARRHAPIPIVTRKEHKRISPGEAYVRNNPVI
jgi:hypothetical protein